MTARQDKKAACRNGFPNGGRTKAIVAKADGGVDGLRTQGMRSRLPMLRGGWLYLESRNRRSVSDLNAESVGQGTSHTQKGPLK